MTIARPLLLTALLLPALLQAAVRPEFASPDNLPAYGVLALPLTPEMTLPVTLGDERSQAITAAASAAKFEGKKGTSATLYATAGYDRVLLLGLGDESLDAPGLEDLGGRIAGAVGKDEARVSVLWSGATDAPFPTAHIALGIQLGSYRFDKYKTPDAEQENPDKPDPRYVIFSADPAPDGEYWATQLDPVAQGVFFARDLISEPANTIYPESFVDRARDAFKGVRGVRIKVLDEREMARLEMGALLGVGMGSERPPRLLVVEYRGGGDKAPVVFAGKGVTFDTGGISLKSGNGVWKMKYDMSGAAAATGAVLALAKREAPVNAVAIAALVENMPSQKAQRPGDVRKTGSGKTIEVINTDAEGRLILSDAVWYAQREYEPALLLDLATLTGSVRVAVGPVYAGLFTRDDAIADALLAAGKASGEELWRLPLHETWRDAIKSDIADIKNVSGDSNGGASVGAEVIGSFVEEGTPWAHLDIAGKAWAGKAEPTVPKGAAGFGVRLLDRLVRDSYQD